MDDPKPRARGDGVPGGVYDHGTHEEDGPETREALTLPHEAMAHGEPSANLRRTGVFAGARRKPNKKKTPAVG